MIVSISAVRMRYSGAIKCKRRTNLLSFVVDIGSISTGNERKILIPSTIASLVPFRNSKRCRASNSTIFCPLTEYFNRHCFAASDRRTEAVTESAGDTFNAKADGAVRSAIFVTPETADAFDHPTPDTFWLTCNGVFAVGF